MKLFTLAPLCAACVLALAACGKKPPPPMPAPTVGFVVLRTEPVTLTTELPGRVSAMESSDVRPQISGVIRRRTFAEGSEVQAGQVLYEIEDSPYRAALLSAQGQLAQAQANIRATQLQANRYRQLVPERPEFKHFERWYAVISARPAFKDQVAAVPLACRPGHAIAEWN